MDSGGGEAGCAHSTAHDSMLGAPDHRRYKKSYKKKKSLRACWAHLIIEDGLRDVLDMDGLDKRGRGTTLRGCPGALQGVGLVAFAVSPFFIVHN
jgi:hypothetical protein